MSNDIDSQDTEKEIINIISKNFDTVKYYIKRFNTVHESFCTNETLDPAVITDEKGKISYFIIVAGFVL